MSLIRSGLSTPSQRNEEAVSGRRIPTLVQPLPFTGAVDVVVVVVLLLPHATSKSINKPTPKTVLNDLRFRSNSFIMNLSFHSVLTQARNLQLRSIRFTRTELQYISYEKCTFAKKICCSSFPSFIAIFRKVWPTF